MSATKQKARIKELKFPSEQIKNEILSGLGVQRFDWEGQREEAPKTQLAIFELRKKKVEAIPVSVNGVEIQMPIEEFEMYWATQRSEQIGIYRNVLPYSSAMFYMITDY